MAGVLTEEDGTIPYKLLARKVFSGQFGSGLNAQEIIPFLGAGVSISARPEVTQHNPQSSTQDPRIQGALAALHLDGRAELFLETAAELALAIQETQDARTAEQRKNLLERLAKDRYPPSAADLVAVLSEESSYQPSFNDLVTRLTVKLRKQNDNQFQADIIDLIRLVASIVGIPSTSLSSISAYYEAVSPRKDLLQTLRFIFSNKTTVSPTHRLLAQAARWHLRKDREGKESAQGDFLIVTTNYDRLMELALTDALLPFVVLTMSKKDFMIHARFGGSLTPKQIAAFKEKNLDRFPSDFNLEPPSLREGDEAEVNPPTTPRLVIVYKIHGCLYEETEEEKQPNGTKSQEEKTDNEQRAGGNQQMSGGRDSVIISDKDYVFSISRMSTRGGVIPSCVSAIMHDKPFLFLGYSLNDWNVRGILKAVRQKRGEEKDDYGDYTVVRSITPLDQAFFDENNIRILKTTLGTLSKKLGRDLAPEGYTIDG